jgi:hypothetical protein
MVSVLPDKKVKVFSSRLWMWLVLQPASIWQQLWWNRPWISNNDTNTLHMIECNQLILPIWIKTGITAGNAYQCNLIEQAKFVFIIDPLLLMGSKIFTTLYCYLNWYNYICKGKRTFALSNMIRSYWQCYQQ